MENENTSTVKAVSLMMIITLVGKLLGLLREIFLAGMSLTWAEDRYHTESETEPVQPNIQCDYDAWVWNSVRTIMVHEIKLVGCKTLKRNLKKILMLHIYPG